jgi:hypothetical protein
VSTQDDFTVGISVATIEFARLLNEARTRLQAAVDECADCQNGILQFDYPEIAMSKGDACPHCGATREFLTRCTQSCGPIVAPAPTRIANE